MLKPKQEKCIKLMLLGSMSQSQIAQELKVTEQTICNWKKNDEFTEKLEQGNRQIISSMVPRAINKLQALLDADSEQVQLAAAKDILDRAGYRTPKEIQIDANVQQETTTLQGILAQLSTPPADL